MKHQFTAALVAAAFALPLTATAQERYPELTPDQLSPQQKAYVENLQKPPRNNTTALKNPPFKVYLRSPDLAAKLEAVSDYVRWGSGQPPRLTELAIMITARQWSSQWIWRGHYRGAVRGGLDPSVGADIAAGKRPEKMKEDETILYNYATEMYRDKAVSDATYAAAAQERYPTLTPDQLSPQQKAYVDNLQKPPRNNTTALQNPPFKVYMRSPDLA
jgi:4-carboxymuconolactone decarboxylase